MSFIPLYCGAERLRVVGCQYEVHDRIIDGGGRYGFSSQSELLDLSE